MALITVTSCSVSTFCRRVVRSRKLLHFQTGQCSSSPAYRAGDSVEFHLTVALWPPNSPDLNPVDYEVWGVLQQRVYYGRIRDVDHLKQRLIEEWRCFDENIIDRAVRQWRVRLRV